MDKIAKYKLKFKNEDDNTVDYQIEGLKMAYYKPSWNHGELKDYGGSSALLKCEGYQGYCVLCISHHMDKTEHLPDPGYTVEFSPLYDSAGRIILVEHGHDEIFSIVNRGYKDYDTGEFTDVILTTYKYGVFYEFTEGTEK